MCDAGRPIIRSCFAIQVRRLACICQSSRTVHLKSVCSDIDRSAAFARKNWPPCTAPGRSGGRRAYQYNGAVCRPRRQGRIEIKNTTQWRDVTMTREPPCDNCLPFPSA
ncbi:hypothetical protein LSAT2_019680 [Lamellibrachia satsuma]|nr:hypothetical protein LSAT2_019680 [Lamellibrachia satsuma]